MKENRIKEIARDIIALGGIPFFALVLIRVSLLSKPYFLFQFIIAGALFFLFMLIFKSSLYSGLGFILLVFTSIYYNDLKFSIFAVLIYTGLIVSLSYLKKEKKDIIKGILFGIISTGISYYAVGLIF